MFDIETLSVASNAALVSISLVEFCLDSGAIGEQMTVLIDPFSCIEHGLVVDNSTMKFCSQQSKEARAPIIKAFSEGLDIKRVLNKINSFLSFHKKVKLWGNGILSDNLWIESAYSSCDIQPRYTYSSHRDVRTLRDIAMSLGSPDYKSINKFEGIKHKPLDDCLHQIKYCSDFFNFIKMGKLESST